MIWPEKLRIMDHQLPYLGFAGTKTWILCIFGLLGLVNICTASKCCGLIPSKVLERTDNTDKTIAFFNKSTVPLEVKEVGGAVCIRKKQCDIKRVISLRDYALKEIPEVMDPGIQLIKLTILDDDQSSDMLRADEDAMDRLAKLLNALATADIKDMALNGFGMGKNTELTRNTSLTTNKTEFYNIRGRLVLHRVSSFFIEWLGAHYDFSQGRKTMGLVVQSSPDITSLVCLDALNITEVCGLWMRFLPGLKDLSCRLILQKQVTSHLALRGFERLVITPNIAQAIAKKNWEGIYMDISFWMAIFSAQPDIDIRVIRLAITTAEDAEKIESYIVTGRPRLTVEQLVIVIMHKDTELTQTLLISMLVWASANFHAIYELKIESLGDVSPEVNALLLRKRRPTIFMATLPRLEILTINATDIMLFSSAYVMTSNVITISYPGVPEYDGGENENEEATTLL
ncbi:hypothetical protein NEDG_02163 [Nematocida displodere]|uniref:Uncharacterized protein n=1 Tax=Nematocida displodere TaxID=1805483 RepID=A0A177EM93_9MICR|nr:hypothetical protein NEDG_02163 [Nematocida displodere]